MNVFYRMNNSNTRKTILLELLYGVERWCNDSIALMKDREIINGDWRVSVKFDPNTSVATFTALTPGTCTRGENNLQSCLDLIGDSFTVAYRSVSKYSGTVVIDKANIGTEEENKFLYALPDFTILDLSALDGCFSYNYDKAYKLAYADFAKDASGYYYRRRQHGVVIETLPKNTPVHLRAFDLHAPSGSPHVVSACIGKIHIAPGSGFLPRTIANDRDASGNLLEIANVFGKKFSKFRVNISAPMFLFNDGWWYRSLNESGEIEYWHRFMNLTYYLMACVGRPGDLSLGESIHYASHNQMSEIGISASPSEHDSPFARAESTYKHLNRDGLETEVDYSRLDDFEATGHTLADSLTGINVELDNVIKIGVSDKSTLAKRANLSFTVDADLASSEYVANAFISGKGVTDIGGVYTIYLFASVTSINSEPHNSLFYLNGFEGIDGVNISVTLEP